MFSFTEHKIDNFWFAILEEQLKNINITILNENFIFGWQIVEANKNLVQ